MDLKSRNRWLAAASLVALVLVGMVLLGTRNKSVPSGAVGAVVTAAPSGNTSSESDVSAADPGKDIILEPVGERVLSSEERRAIDEARGAVEDEAMRRWVDKQVEDGVFVTSEPRPCMVEAKSVSLVDAYDVVSCGGAIAGLARPAVESDDVREILVARVESVLQGVTAAEEADGYYSMFSGTAELKSLTIDKAGVVRADFTPALLDPVSPDSTSDQLELFNLQLYDALFRPDGVERVEITIDGECVRGKGLGYGDRGCSMTRSIYDSLWYNVEGLGIAERTSP
ncbi:hypothetical protein MNBD_ACTINO02-1963 [hydrothermal vent metagenome]|uniref:GerMN domain-containing protein n=1 Tax=hydrothermal vent metagenome TaxID=652676 RepID=A0A3B0SHI9_9ZZZZ